MDERAARLRTVQHWYRMHAAECRAAADKLETEAEEYDADIEELEQEIAELEAQDGD